MRVGQLISVTLACALLLAGSTRPLALLGLHLLVGLTCLKCMGESQDRLGASLRTQKLVKAMMWLALPAVVCLLPMPLALVEWLAPGSLVAHGADRVGVFSLAPAHTIGAFFGWWLACGLVASVGIWSAHTDARHLSEKAAVWGLAGYVAVAGGHALVGAERIFGLIEVQQLADRVLLPLVNPNHVATPILLLLPVAVGWGYDQFVKGDPRGWLALLVVVASLGLVIFTGSVGAPLSLLVMVFVAWIYASTGKSRLIRALMVLMVSLGVLALVVNRGLIDEVWLDASWWPRIAEADQYGSIIQGHWFSGVGPGAFFKSAGLYSDHLKTVSITDHAHIGVAEWFLETGLVGLVVVGLAWYKGPDWGESRCPERAWRWTLGLVGVGLHSLVDFPLQVKAILLLTLSVLTVRLIAYPPLERGSARGMRRMLLGLVIAQGLGAVWQLHAFIVHREAEFALDFEVDSARAGRAAERLSGLAPWRMESELVRMWQSETLGDSAAALQQATRIVARHPADPDAQRYAGYTYLRLNAVEQAQGAFEQSIVWRPSDYRAWLMLSGIAEEQGRSADGARAMLQAIRHWPRGLWPGWWGDAAPLLQGYAMLPVGLWWVDGLSDADGRWSWMLGGLLLEGGDPEAALLAYEQAELLGPFWVRQHPGQAKALVAQGRVEEAEALLLEKIETGTVSALILKELALIRAAQGKEESALKLMLDGLLLAENQDQFAGHCVHDMARVSTNELGIRLGERLLLLGHGGPVFSTHLADLYFRVGRKVDCRRMVGQVGRLMPESIKDTWRILTEKCAIGP